MMPRHAARRDTCEPEIIAAARQLGVRAWKLTTPVDWLVLIVGHWFPCELKATEMRGRVHEFTPAQAIFMTDAANARGEVLVWHTVAEMVADVQRIRITQR